MNTHSDKTQENKNSVVVNELSNQSKGGESTFQFADNRTETIAQRKLQNLANKSLQAAQSSEKVAQKQGLEEEEPLQGKFNALQMKAPEEEELLQGKFEPVQKQGWEEEEPLQGKFIPVQMKAPEEEELLQGKFEPIQKKENNTGLPDNLKSGIEDLSGYSLDDVKVNLNSNKPEQLNAHAYAQGTDIHVAPGQEKHLPHEAWHVVQQKQGRVKPTMQMKGNVNVNDDAGLEKEADVMGAKALQRKLIDNENSMVANSTTMQKASNDTIQLQQTEVCLKSASGTYNQGGNQAILNFNFMEASKGEVVLVTTKSHPKGQVNYDEKIISVLKKNGTIPKDATKIIITASDTYGIKK